MSDIDTISGRLIVFRGEDDESDKAAHIELTEFQQNGSVEIAFDYDKRRFYLKFKLHELLERIAADNGSKP